MSFYVFWKVWRRIVDVPPNAPGGVSSRSVHLGVTTARTLKMSRFLIWTKESKSGKSFWETDFRKSSAKHGLLCQILSRHLNIFFKMGEFRKPWLGAEGHMSVITGVVSARELGYDWGRSLREHPRSTGHRPASTNHDINFWKLCVSLFRLLA